MVSPVLLQKDDARLPDCYGVKIKYITGKIEQFTIASHMYSKETGLLEIWTHEDTKVSWIPMSSVERVEFDKDFTKVLNIRSENMAKEKNASNK